MKTAFLCPGQGSQSVGMGADLYERIPAARSTYDEANGVLGWSVSELSFSGPPERLNDTRFTQPALFVMSFAAGRALIERGVKPDVCAGHSLGEYSALALAGALSFQDGLKLVVARANSMADAGRTHSGAMAAVIGLDDATVNSALEGIDGVVAANFNAPDQVVISGTADAVRTASEKFGSLGAKRVVQLNVSGAFHSPLMKPAAEALGEALSAAPITKPTCPVVANVTAEPTTDPTEIRSLLLRQITSPVRWTESVRTLRGMEVDRAFEVGPGKVLQGLARRIDRDLSVSGAGTAEELESIAR